MNFNYTDALPERNRSFQKKNRRARIAFAKEHLNWMPQQWSRVILTDESKFNRFGSDGKVYVRRCKGEEFRKNCIKPTVKGGDGSVLVWGSMTAKDTGPIERDPSNNGYHGQIRVFEYCVLNKKYTASIRRRIYARRMDLSNG